MLGPGSQWPQKALDAQFFALHTIPRHMFVVSCVAIGSTRADPSRTDNVSVGCPTDDCPPVCPGICPGAYHLSRRLLHAHRTDSRHRRTTHTRTATRTAEIRTLAVPRSTDSSSTSPTRCAAAPHSTLDLATAENPPDGYTRHPHSTRRVHTSPPVTGGTTHIERRTRGMGTGRDYN